MKERPHGTYARYCRDHCLCDPCSEAGRTYRNRYRHLRVTRGRLTVDATPVREHCQRLIAAGMAMTEIATASGYSATDLKTLIDGGRPRVRAVTAARILAVHPAQGGRVGFRDGCGARRRIQALVAAGWPLDYISERAGKTRTWAYHMTISPTVTVPTHQAVCAVYDALWDQTPPATQASRTARNRAARKGYAMASQWDDDPTSPHGIDNPQAGPAPITRSRKQDRDADQLADVEHLLGYQLSPHHIAAQLGYRDRASLAAWLRRHDRGDLAVLFERKHAA